MRGAPAAMAAGRTRVLSWRGACPDTQRARAAPSRDAGAPDHPPWRLPVIGPFSTERRLRRELATVEAMIGMYCRAHHGGGAAPCAECRELMAYARQRIDRCPFGAGKPTCVNCPVHCYAPAMRERVRVVMRYAGPRMAWRHPILALMHLLDGRRAAPPPGRRT